jgi:hypothetical protein
MTKDELTKMNIESYYKGKQDGYEELSDFIKIALINAMKVSKKIFIENLKSLQDKKD